MTVLKTVACALLLLQNVCLPAQESLQSKLKAASDFEEIVPVILNHYDTLKYNEQIRDRQFEPKEIHAMRWLYEMSSRLGPDGSFVHIPRTLYKASRERKQTTANNSRSSEGLWHFVGPATSPYSGSAFSEANGLGRVDRIAFHPSLPGTIYAATPAGGLWKTTNYGSSWVALSSNLPSMGISGLVVSHADPNTIYLLTGDGDSYILNGLVPQMGYGRLSFGVFKTIDGGETWTKTGALGVNEGIVGLQLVQSPADPQVLLAATEDGLYRTANGGGSWTKVFSGRVFDVAFKPGDGTRAYAVVHAYNRFRYSNDGGQTWPNESNIYSSTMNRLNIAVTAADPERVYVLTGPRRDSTEFRGVYVSYNSGASFMMQIDSPNILGPDPDGIANSDGALYTLAFAASSANAGHFVTGSFICWRSTDGGQTIENITPYWEYQEPDAYVHPDIHDLAYNPLNDNVYAAGDGGVYRSTDNGDTWTFISAGLSVTQFYHLAGTSTDVDWLLGGTQDNGIKLRTTDTGIFTHILCCDGFDVDFRPADNTQFIASVNSSKHRFSNSGLNMTSVTPPGDSTWFSTMLYHNTSGGTFFVGSVDIFKTTNSGSTFTNTGASGTWAFAAAPSDDTRFYAAGGTSAFTQTGSFYQSTNTGDSWTTMTNPAPGIKLTDIAVHPANADQVWVTVGGFNPGQKVFYSANGGSTWTNQSGSLPDVPVNCIAIDNNNHVYVGTDIGVFCRPSSSSDWTPFYNGLPNVPVTELVINDPANKIRAATFGRGAWDSDRYSACPPVWLLTTLDLSGDLFYQASDFVQVSVNVEGGADSYIRLRGADHVMLLPGFEAQASNSVHATTGPCNSGIPD